MQAEEEQQFGVSAQPPHTQHEPHSPLPWYMLGFHLPLGGFKVVLTSLIPPVVQEQCRDSAPEHLYLQLSQHGCWLSSGHRVTDMPQPCMKSPVKALPQEPPTSRTEM